jgi:putative transposase
MDVAFLMERFQFSERRACELSGMDRASYRYEPRTDRSAGLRQRLTDLARPGCSCEAPGRVQLSRRASGDIIDHRRRRELREPSRPVSAEAQPAGGRGQVPRT